MLLAVEDENQVSSGAGRRVVPYRLRSLAGSGQMRSSPPDPSSRRSRSSSPLARGSVPVSVAWLPVLLVPQLLLTAGLCWFLAALGIFLRDLGQVMGFVLTLWFFLTPICYSEASLPVGALRILWANPIFVLVRGYRAIFLESHAPDFASLAALWAVSVAIAIGGYAWFHKLRRSFADLI